MHTLSQTRYFMPPEWVKHKMTLLTWPDNRETWPGDRLNRAEHVYADILQALTPHEKVLLLVANEQSQQAAAAMIHHRNIDWDRIRLIRMPVNDVWIRDYGPICLFDRQNESSAPGAPTHHASTGRESAIHTSTEQPQSTHASTGRDTTAHASTERPQSAHAQTGRESAATHPTSSSSASAHSGQLVMSNWGYNAWGGKYPPFDADNAVPAKLARLLNCPEVPTGMILEGGSIDVNGAGCVMTTESVLINPNRNPGWNKNTIEEKLKYYLGVEKVIWLKEGLKGDDTDGHIDDLARFVSARTIVTSVSDNPEDPNYHILLENLQILREATDAHGQPFEIIELPLPVTKIQETTVDGSEYVPASYANFYIANGCVLLPLYDQRYDDKVVEIFRSLFPDRQIHGIHCNNLVWGQGSIHCITQQVPMDTNE